VSNRLQKHLTYANVVATMALFIAVGGASSFAATQLRKNSVGAPQLRRNSVTAVKIKDGSVTAAKLAAGVISAPKTETAATPSAPASPSSAAPTSAPVSGPVAEALNAQTIAGMTVTQIIEAAKPRCPAGTRVAAGVCFEIAVRPKMENTFAQLNCGQDERRLPSISELIAYEDKYFTSFPPKEWAEPSYYDGSVYRAAALASQTQFVELGYLPQTEKLPYQCVIAPS
jgi:hypothetical protein